MIDFSGKVAAVTGAGSGIGRASACAFARAGAKVAVSDLDVESGRETVGLIEAAGGAATFVACDVADEKAVDNFIDETVRRLGRLDYAHNNAGVENKMSTIADGDTADFTRVLSVDLNGVWYCMRAELRQMRRQGGGAIVNTSSVAGVAGLPGGSSYCAAKHGVIGLTRSAALENAAAGIRVNAISPGLTRSRLTDRLNEAHPGMLQLHLPPLGRMAEPEEMAGPVLFLCSDLASYLTGQCLVVDGGFRA